MTDLMERMTQLATAAPGGGANEKRLLSLSDVRQLAAETGFSIREVELRALQARILPGRYERSHGTVGWEGQIRLLESTVAVVGCGGLGGWIVEGLSRMGLGHLVIVDGDEFAENNLNRQACCTEGNLEERKTEAAGARVAAVNSATQVTLYSVMANEESLREMLTGADVVVDALDTISTRLVLQKVAQDLGIPMVHGAIAGYVGQAMTIFPGEPGLYAIYGREDVPERGVEAEVGNPAATPMMVAAWQIQEVVKILLGAGDLLRNRLLVMDAESATVRILGVRA